MGRFSQIRNAMVFAFAPPAVVELGTAKGFDFQLLDRGGLGHAELVAARNQLLGMAAQDPVLTKVRPNGFEDVPEYRVDVDWEKAGAMGVPISDIHNTISAAFGSAYVNDFIQGGRVKRVFAQADAPYRMLPKDLEKLYVRNNGEDGSLFSPLRPDTGLSRFSPIRLPGERFNGFSSINIQGEPAPGRSSGEAMQAMEDFVKKLPQGTGFDWNGLSYQERQARSQTAPLYAFSILVIFLCLAALYESWPIPISILLALPLGVIGGVIGTSLRGLPNDIYFQIGLLTTLGLTTKNAILIVQFAKARVDRRNGTDRGDFGRGQIEAASHHHDLAGLRLRRAAAGLCRRGGRRRAKGHRHRRAGRRGHLHLPGHFVCAAVLCVDPEDPGQTRPATSPPKPLRQIHPGTTKMNKNTISFAGWNRRHPGWLHHGSKIHAGRQRRSPPTGPQAHPPRQPSPPPMRRTPNHCAGGNSSPTKNFNRSSPPP